MNTDRTLKSLLFLAPWLALSAISLPASAQRDTDPNLGHFYMARQQVTITDETPVVVNKKNPPAQPGAPGAGSLPAGVPPLPAARWSQYAPIDTPPSLSSSLPKVSNGVPKAPPPGPPGTKGKTGKLAAGAKPKTGPGPAVDKSVPAAYEPYKKFSPEAAVSGANQSSGNVKGDVLHWARRAQQGRL
jgi:hypothetical protein